MQVVINISDKDYQNLKAKDKFDDMYLNYYEKLIVNGIPLPQNHGDLKDMNDIYEALESWNDDTGWIIDAIDFQTETIVKADEGEE